MKTLARLLLAGLVFVTPTAAVAGLTDHGPCYIAKTPHRAECELFKQRMTFA